eukprot:gene107-143_t
MSIKVTNEAVLAYHAQKPAGKLGIQATKPLKTQYDLSLAYTPGVAIPCRLIAEDKQQVYNYTSKGNLVAVISNGTAVLGLGNIGPEASKPVMEGKAVLFKKFAGIDSFDIEIDATDPQEVVRVIKAIAPTFGGINLEDFKAPECFEIENTLKAQLDIPVMHDDQHGTAIIAGAALKNAVLIAKKKIDAVTVVINGAGAGAIACAKLLMAIGVKQDHIVMCDTQGVIRKDREGLSGEKSKFATDQPVHTLAEALKGADVFLGLSKADILQPAHILSMAARPIVFALANPNPEINYELAISTRPDLIMATGRSDYPNQANNVLGYPYIFRGALDVWATAINEPMKLAAVDAIAALAQEPVPSQVKEIYGIQGTLAFGPTYLLPKPFDPRLITTVSPAVAKAAIQSGVARKVIEDWEGYKRELQQPCSSRWIEQKEIFRCHKWYYKAIYNCLTLVNIKSWCMLCLPMDRLKMQTVAAVLLNFFHSMVGSRKMLTGINDHNDPLKSIKRPLFMDYMHVFHKHASLLYPLLSLQSRKLMLVLREVVPKLHLAFSSVVEP